MSPRTTVVYSTTAANTGLVGAFAFQVLADATFTSVTGTLSGYSIITFPAGALIYCSMTAFTLASGTIVVYFG